MLGQEAKYIVFLSEMCYEIPLIFSPLVQHSDIGRGLGGEIVSAGFVSSDFNCYGESVSLKTRSRPEEDSVLIKKMFKVWREDE